LPPPSPSVTDPVGCNYQWAGSNPISDSVLYGDCVADFTVSLPGGDSSAFVVSGPAAGTCSGSSCRIYIVCGGAMLPSGGFVVTAVDGTSAGLASNSFTIVGGADPDGPGPDGPTSCGPVF
jgi:hypothetical protein